MEPQKPPEAIPLNQASPKRDSFAGRSAHAIQREFCVNGCGPNHLRGIAFFYHVDQFHGRTEIAGVKTFVDVRSSFSSEAPRQLIRLRSIEKTQNTMYRLSGGAQVRGIGRVGATNYERNGRGWGRPGVVFAA
jgi:hypothetical protein